MRALMGIPVEKLILARSLGDDAAGSLDRGQGPGQVGDDNEVHYRLAPQGLPRRGT